MFDNDEKERESRLFRLMLGVFLGGGLLASIETLVVPQLKLALHLNYAQALLVQLIYFSGYLVYAWPAAHLVARIGPMRSTAVGLAVVAFGCTLVAAAEAELFVASMLGALLLLSAGVTLLQIACNGVMATRGGKASAASNFTLLQGFNSVGTTLGPLIAATFFLPKAASIAPGAIFLGFALCFGALAFAFLRNRDLLGTAPAARPPNLTRLIRLIRRPRMMAGTLAIFAYVGAEVTIGTLAVSYLMLANHAHIEPVTAARFVSLYWGGAMVGRFAGSWVLRRLSAARLLGLGATGAIGLLSIAMSVDGVIGSAALLAVGLCNSIMFPTIYALAMPDDTISMPAGAMLLCMAVVGGAVVPMITGLTADRTPLVWALAVPLFCYLAIGAFARGERRRSSLNTR